MCPEQIMDLLIQVIFVFIGIVAALWYENLGSPRIYFSQAETLDRKLENGQRARSLCIKVLNSPKRFPFVPRQTATSCHGSITFLDSDQKPISQPMQIRWADSPEPIKNEISNNEIVKLPEQNLIRLSRYIDIPPDESEICDLAIRFYGEDTAYGWNTYSYFKNMRHPDFQISQGEAFARLSLFAGDSKFESFITFMNPKEYDKFELKSFKAL